VNRVQAFIYLWAAISHSVQRLATGWTVRESNPVGARFSAPVLSLVHTQPPVQWVPGLTRG
jgi:hypothetical protein